MSLIVLFTNGDASLSRIKGLLGNFSENAFRCDKLFGDSFAILFIVSEKDIKELAAKLHQEGVKKIFIIPNVEEYQA